MSDSTQSNLKEVFIVKKKTSMSSEEFLSINLKSPDDSVESLLQKAMSIVNSDQSDQDKKNINLI